MCLQGKRKRNNYVLYFNCILTLQQLVTYLGTLCERGAVFAAQLVSPLQHRHNAPVAAAVGQLDQLVRHPLEVVFDLRTSTVTNGLHNSALKLIDKNLLTRAM